MKSIIMLVGSAPHSHEALRALQVAEALQGLGYPVDLCLVKDGVLGILRHEQKEGDSLIEKLQNVGASCHYLAEDLAMRGFSSEDTLPGASPVDYGKIVELLKSHDKTLGIF